MSDRQANPMCGKNGCVLAAQHDGKCVPTGRTPSKVSLPFHNIPRGVGSTIKHGRGWAEYLGGTRVRFYFPNCEHTEIVDYAKNPVSKRIGEMGVRMMASWWSREKGGVVVGPCRRCANKKEARAC